MFPLTLSRKRKFDALKRRAAQIQKLDRIAIAYVGQFGKLAITHILTRS
jgi:hypothetical protein